MKKTGVIVIGILFISLVISTSSFSASIADIAGVWDTWSEAKLKISKLGTFTDQNPSVTQLNLSGTFVLDETTSTGPYSYTGTFTIINEKNFPLSLTQMASMS